MKATLKQVLTGLLCLILSIAQALEDQSVEKITIQLYFIPDIDDGKATFSICARCHFPEAWGNVDGSYPHLA